MTTIVSKERPWAEHFTSLPKRGVGALSSESAFQVNLHLNHKGVPIWFMSYLQWLNALKTNTWFWPYTGNWAKSRGVVLLHETTVHHSYATYINIPVTFSSAVHNRNSCLVLVFSSQKTFWLNFSFKQVAILSIWRFLCTPQHIKAMNG